MKWINGKLYPCKPMGKYPLYVKRTMLKKYKAITISYFDEISKEGFTLNLTTRYARLLLKRLNQALNDK